MKVYQDQLKAMTNNKIRLTSNEMSELSQNAKGLIMTTNKNFIGFS